MTALTDEKLAEIEKRHEQTEMEICQSWHYSGANVLGVKPYDGDIDLVHNDRAALLAEVKRQAVDIQILLAALKEIARDDSPFSAQAIATAALSAKDKA